MPYRALPNPILPIACPTGIEELAVSDLHIPQLIERKRDGAALTPAEIQILITEYGKGHVLDAQMSALAMAIFFRGMSPAETAALTSALRDSGEVWTWPEGSPLKIDKHSTGGVGDKVSLILAPLLACTGAWIPMVSGRGLGITGGTLDKLESIPGYQVRLDYADALCALEKNGAFIAGQSDAFCPADRQLYALRDVTGTTPSPALIVASIMSKKLAEGLDRLVLDVKFGKGAFMQEYDDALAMAEALKETGQRHGVATSYLMSAMDEPLGRTIGNALEMIEAVETLQGRGPADLIDLILRLAEQIAPASRSELEHHLRSGAAWQRWCAMVDQQQGDVSTLEQLDRIHRAPIIRPWKSPQSGFVQTVDAAALARASIRLGAGRRTPADAIDPAVGLSAIRKSGESVEKDEPLFMVHARREADIESVTPLLNDAVVFQ